MRSVTAVSASLLACLAVAPPAFGAEVNAKDPSRWVRVKANDGEVNRLTLSRADNAVTVSDAGADVLAGDGCDQVGPSEVRCVIDGEPRVDVSLGDGDDEATALGALQVKLDGESGNDALNGGDADDKLDGGDGDDTLAGGAGSDGYDGGEGNDTVRARDSVRESVLCGGGEDGGDADVEDELAPDCEGVAKPIAPPSLVEPAPGAPPAPEPGSSVAVAVKTGTVLARIPGASGFAPLDPTRPAPVGTVFDTRNGTLTLTAAKDQVGGTQTADFRGGKFAVAQAPGATMTTDLRMRGGSFAGCPSVTARASVARAAASRRRVVRKLWGSGKGRFRTRGRHSSATVRGTTWEVVDRCDGTLTRVRSGIVVVANNRTGRTKVVKAGESFFVRRRARR